jgi:hypothetical protein
MNKGKWLSTKMISLSGIFLAFILVLLFVAGSTSSFQMVAYCLSSIFTIIIIEESNIKVGAIFYIAAALLTILILPNKIAVLPYILFFGHYGIWFSLFPKLFNVESKHSASRLLSQFCKYVIANICAVAIYFVCKDLIANLKIVSTFLLVPAAELFIVLFDYMYGRCLYYYRRDVKSKIM